MATTQLQNNWPLRSAGTEDFFFGLFEKSPNGMAVVCPESLTYQAANAQFRAISGYTADELADRNVATLVADDETDRYVNDLIAHVQESGSATLNREVRYVTKAGEPIPVVENVVTVEFPALDTRYLLIGAAPCATQPEADCILSALLKHTADEVWTVGPDNRILLASRAFCSRHDISEADIGAPDSAALIRGQTPADLSMHRAVLETGETRRQMLSYAMPDGRREMYSTVKFPIALGEAGGTAVGTVATNISAISQSAEALRDRDVQIRQITDSLHVLIFRLDESMKFKYMNQAGAEWWGVPAEGFVGKHYADIIGSDLFELRRPYLEEVMAGKTVTHSSVTAYPDGKTRHVNVTYIPQRGTPGMPNGIIGLIEDVTERKQIEDQLARASKMEGIGQLAAGIAHEINTPIQYIGDNLGFLRDASESLFDLVRAFTEYIAVAQAGGDLSEARARVDDAIEAADLDFLKEDVPDAIERSLQGVKDVARIVLSMKDFSHPSNKERTPVDVNQAVRNTLTISRNEWKHVARIEEDLDDGLPNIPGFPGELNQVLLNVIVNGAHAIAERDEPGLGTIGVRTRCTGDHVEIRISDTGRGIPEEVRERIFEPFFTTKDVGRGTGQGLAISWDIVVDKHGGTIDIDSEPGRGTTFILTLPL